MGHVCNIREKNMAERFRVWPKINIQSESHKIFSMPICLQRPKEAFECGPGPLTHILNGLKCIQIISWKHSLKWSSNFTVEFYEYWPCWAPEPGALYLALTSTLTFTWSGHETWDQSSTVLRDLFYISNFSQLFHDDNSDGGWQLTPDNVIWRMTTSGPSSGARRRLNTDICCDKCFLGWLIIRHLHTRSANQPGQQMSLVSIVSEISAVSPRGPK